MREFQPYTIHHVRLESAGGEIVRLESARGEIVRLGASGGVELPAGHHYVVFWKGGVPLGHCWVESPGEAVVLKDREIGAAIGPALAHYEKGGDSGDGDGTGLSVVVCTRNRPEDLERCIRSLLASRDKDFELIVVDNASDGDRTREVVATFPGVKYCWEDRPGLDIARNAGARLATRELIAYTDDDVEVDTEWTGGMKKAFDDPLVMAVTGLVIPARLETEAQYLFERYWGFNKGYVPRTFDHGWFLAYHGYSAPVWEIGAGANMAFRRDLFLLAGLFDERLDVGAAGCSGDSELWYRVLAEGWNCRYLPELVVYHHHRRSLDGLQQQLYHYMRGHVCALLIQNARYGHRGNKRRLFAGLPLYYLRRTARWLFGGRRGREANGTMMTELHGCISGWRYYHRSTDSEGGFRDRGDGSVDPGGGFRDRGDGSANVPGVRETPQLDSRETPQLHSRETPLKKAVVTEKTLVSVIIPCYNHGRYLDAAIRSVGDQTHRIVEIVVIDDGSTDDTEEVCRRYEGVRYCRVQRVGPCAARNIGVRMSTGAFLVFLDADDILYPQALELNLYFFDYYPDAAFVSGAHDRMDREGRLLPGPIAQDRGEDNYKALLMGNYIGMEATVMYRRELFFRYFFDPSLDACEDYDLNLRIARELPVYGHSHKLAAYRLHGKNRSADKRFMYRQAIRVLQQQQRWLRSEEEKSCYELGVKNWKTYYL